MDIKLHEQNLTIISIVQIIQQTTISYVYKLVKSLLIMQQEDNENECTNCIGDGSIKSLNSENDFLW